VLPPVSRFTPTGERSKKRETVLEKQAAYFTKFWDISNGKLFRETKIVENFCSFRAEVTG